MRKSTLVYGIAIAAIAATPVMAQNAVEHSGAGADIQVDGGVSAPGDTTGFTTEHDFFGKTDTDRDDDATTGAEVPEGSTDAEIMVDSGISPTTDSPNDPAHEAVPQTELPAGHVDADEEVDSGRIPAGNTSEAPVQIED